jgi:valyl-tRNA synthetase
MEQSADVLDTWFSSALWPFAALGWPASVKTAAGRPQPVGDLKEFYPTDVLSTARDIINLWVARMVFSGMFFTGKEPFHTVYVHATVLTRVGQRMSKSLGTGIDPLELAEKYGADSVRFGLVWQTMGGQDMHFSEEHIVAGKKFCNKIWKAARFVLERTAPSSEVFTKEDFNNSERLTDADKKILAKLAEITKETNKCLEKFEFGQALHGLYDFFWHDFCDEFIEASKKESAAESKLILFQALTDSLKLLHPFIPFITEEIFQIIQDGQKIKKLLIVETYPQK